MKHQLTPDLVRGERHVSALPPEEILVALDQVTRLSEERGSWRPPATSGRASAPLAIPVEPSLSLLRTKLSRPRSRSDLLARPGLLERLNGGRAGPLTLVSAPAGFGKTTLLAQWVQTLDRPTAWLCLDEHDNALPVFLHGLVAALQGVVPEAMAATANLVSAAHFPSGP